MQDVSSWLGRYNQQLNYISTALVGAGVIYLLASNWFIFPKVVQLAIPQCLLFASCLLSIYFTPSTIKGHCIIAFAALMTGLSLTTYGQIYQTGADSFQLFAVWSVLLIPWLYFRLAAVWIIFDVTVLLTFYLADKQWLALNNEIYLFYFSLLLLALIGLAHIFCRSSRLVLMMIISMTSCFLSIFYLTQSYIYYSYNGSEHDPFQFGWIFISFITPLIIATLFYVRRWAAGISIAVLTFAINSSFWFIKEYVPKIDNSAGIIFSIAALIFLWCWALSKVLRYFLPDNLNWSGLPSVFGAWICSILLTIGFYILFDNNITVEFGIVLLIGGFILLFFQTKNLFVRQLSFAITLCGQALLFSHIIFEYQYGDVKNYLLIAQITILACSWLITASQFWRSLQCLIFVGLYLLAFPNTFIYLLFIPFVIWAIFPSLMANENWNRPILCGLLTASVALMAYNFSIGFHFDYDNLNDTSHFTISQIFALISVIAASIFAYRYINLVTYVPFIILSLLLISFNLLPILAILMALVLINQCQDNLMSFLSMLALAICLWIFYYSLGMPLIIKGVTIICSGILVGLISYFGSSRLEGNQS